MPEATPCREVVAHGRLLYYLGLLPALLAIPASAAGLLAGVTGIGWGWFLWSVITFVAGSSIFVLGTLLKRRSYVLAARDGIHVDDF